MQHRIRLTVSSWASWSGPSTDKCNRKRQQDASLRIVSIRPQCFNSECRSRRYRSQRGTWLISGNSCLCRTHFVNTICLSKTFSFFKAADYLRRSQEIFQVKSVSLTFYKFIRSYSLMIRIQKSRIFRLSTRKSQTLHSQTIFLSFSLGSRSGFIFPVDALPCPYSKDSPADSASFCGFYYPDRNSKIQFRVFLFFISLKF